MRKIRKFLSVKGKHEISGGWWWNRSKSIHWRRRPWLKIKHLLVPMHSRQVQKWCVRFECACGYSCRTTFCVHVYMSNTNDDQYWLLVLVVSISTDSSPAAARWVICNDISAANAWRGSVVAAAYSILHLYMYTYDYKYGRSTDRQSSTSLVPRLFLNNTPTEQSDNIMRNYIYKHWSWYLITDVSAESKPWIVLLLAQLQTKQGLSLNAGSSIPRIVWYVGTCHVWFSVYSWLQVCILATSQFKASMPLSASESYVMMIQQRVSQEI